MDNISLPKRIIYRYLGTMYWLIHWTITHNVLGLRVSSLIRLVSLALLILVWIQRWNRAGLILALLFFLWIQFSYWRGKRTGYFRFVGEDVDLLSSGEINPLEKNKQIPVCATGIFSLKNWESNVVFRPAQYWQVPLGDHAVMVELEPGRYLYQFISPELMQNLQRGWLLFGSQPNPAISISFLSTWGPEFSDENFSRLGKDKPLEKLRTIYLSFENKAYEEAVWHNVLFDARRVRSEQA